MAVLLLPACYGAAAALWRVMRASGQAETIWIAALAGAACWLSIYLLLPKPMWIYVFGHELTHALWTWAMGGRVRKFKASREGGHVVVTKNNFLIALAPYFFPLYAVLVMAGFAAGQRLWNWQSYAVWFHLLLGAAYAFHITLTWHILKTSQSDIASQGYAFSAVVIFLGNILLLLIGIPVVTAQTDIWSGFGWWWSETVDALRRMAGLVSALRT